MEKILDAKKELMNKINIGDIVVHSKVDGKRFVVEYLDNRNFLVGIRGIHINEVSTNELQYGGLLWVDPEDIIIANNRYPVDDAVKAISKYGDKAEKTYSLGTNIKKVIFNNPATIVFWSDGSKTVVKAHNDDYDLEKGLAMAIAKKALGNEGNYYNVFKKWLPNEDSSEEIRDRTCYEIAGERFNEILDKITKEAFRGF